jgi:cell division protein FtsQ
MKRILSILFWVVIVAGVSSLFIFANQRQKQLVCPEFRIEVDYRHAPVLLTQGNIRQEITRQKIKVRGNEIGNIEVGKIQQILNENPFIKQAALTIGVNGIVKASIVQRNPLVRVIDLKGQQFYIDDEGGLMPLSMEFPARVIVASGNIKPIGKIRKTTERKDKLQAYKSLPVELQNVYLTSVALRKDVLSNALIEQIYISDGGDVELFPKIGHQKIILGDTTRIDEKLKNLKVFYTSGMKNAGWDTYKTINLKFRNQVVCTKTK